MINQSHTIPSVDLRSFEGKILRESYLLQKYIGEGVFGAVFKSEQSFLGVPARRVAVKLSKHSGISINTARIIFADAFLLAQIMDQMMDAQARSRLVHVYDMGILPEEDHRAFIVMEYIQGTTLTQQFALFRRVPAVLLLKWAQQLCHALADLHRLVPPILHRDLKPDNILLGLDHTLHIVDFGLAARLLHQGYTPGVVGTLSYMAPETTQGESVPASDVYSLGVILYEGLTGQHPFAHLFPPPDLPAWSHCDWLYRQKSTNRLTPPSFLNNTVSATLDTIVLRCLEFHVHRRYQNAGDLLRDLSNEAR
jgi:serine/threonine protein kinase